MNQLNIYKDVNYAECSLPQLDALDVLVRAEICKTSINISYKPDLNQYIRTYAIKYFGDLPKLNDTETIDAIVTSYIRDNVKPQFSDEERAKDDQIDAFPYYDETCDLWYYSLLHLILDEVSSLIDKRIDLLIEAEENAKAA